MFDAIRIFPKPPRPGKPGRMPGERRPATIYVFTLKDGFTIFLDLEARGLDIRAAIALQSEDLSVS